MVGVSAGDWKWRGRAYENGEKVRCVGPGEDVGIAPGADLGFGFGGGHGERCGLVSWEVVVLGFGGGDIGGARSGNGGMHTSGP